MEERLRGHLVHESEFVMFVYLDKLLGEREREREREIVCMCLMCEV